MNQQQFWDAVAPAKAFSHPFDLERFARLVSRDARVLDYGCGYGRLCGALSAAGYIDVVGVDMSPRMIDRARSEHPTLAFDVLDGDRLPFGDASVAAVLLFSVLTCIVEDDGQRRVLSEIARVLRPNGVLYVSDILLQEDARNRARYDAARAVQRAYGTFELEPGVWFRHLDRSWVDELLRGFNRIELVEVPIVTMNGNPARGFQYIGHARDFHRVAPQRVQPTG